VEFHHLGVACTDLDAEEAAFAPLGYERERDDFTDPLQGIQGRFLVGGGPRLELLVALPGSNVLASWLARGTKVYHQAYQVPNLGESTALLHARRARTVSEPKPAVAFDGRQVTFLVLPNLLLIELIEAPLRTGLVRDHGV